MPVHASIALINSILQRKQTTSYTTSSLKQKKANKQANKKANKQHDVIKSIPPPPIHVGSIGW